MKIPVWIILLLIVIVGVIAVYVDLKPQPKPVNPMQKEYDSLINVINRQDKFIAYQDSVISHRDTIIKKEIQYVKTSSETAFRLSSDSSYKLFIHWAAMFRDSGARERYLRTDSNGFYQ